MKYLTLSAIIFAGVLLYSCSKKDKDSDKFVCDIASSNFPAGDTAIWFIPNAFTPNGDGLNDVFRPRFANIQSIEWSVYDQKNNQLFSTTDPNAYFAPSASFHDGLLMLHYKVKAVSNQGNTFSKCGSFYEFSCIPANYNGVDTLLFSDQYNPNAPQGYLNAVSQDETNFVPCK